MKTPGLNGTRTPPPVQDSSRVPPTKSTTVNDGTRSSTAKTPPTLGPRCA